MATETEVGELLHQRGRRTAFTVSGMTAAWAALVHTIDEYTNDPASSPGASGGR